MSKKYILPEDTGCNMAKEPEPALQCEAKPISRPMFTHFTKDSMGYAEEPMTMEEFQARLDSYDEIDENDTALWESSEDCFSEIAQHIRDYADKVGKAF